MIQGVCSCGSCGWQYDGVPEYANACNCKLCRRYGALWAYDWENERIIVSGNLRPYQRTDLAEQPMLEVLFCPTCACVISWRSLTSDDDNRRRMAVNLRLADFDRVAEIKLFHFDGLNSFQKLSEDGTRVKDMWF
ncbi:MAG: GFA family protein [bacterium]